MPDLPITYEQQLAKLRRTNLYMIICFMAAMFIVLCILIAWGASVNNKLVSQNEAQNKLIIEQTAKNRQRGDTLVCILGIPANTRTQALIDACFAKYGLNRNDFIATPPAE